MKKLIEWIIGAIIFIAFLAVVGNLEVFLEKQFPNPYEKTDEK